MKRSFISLIFIILLLNACNLRDPKLAQYQVQGERLYAQHCSNCHQEDGKGFSGLYPPLAASDYLVTRKDEVVCMIRYGMDSAIMVNGKLYEQPMPGNEKLTDLEIAEIVTYVLTKWGGEEEITEVSEISRIISRCN